MKNEETTEVPPVTDYFDNPKFRQKIGSIFEAEENIDDNETLYLITWCPDPSDLPDADFETQHDYNVPILTWFCQSCKTAVFCVESTQKGNPHYHGFYQETEDPDLYEQHNSIVKTMQKFGMLKITPSKGMYKRHNYWTPHSNCLYYYKKDTLTRMLKVHNSVIDQYSEPKEKDWWTKS